VTIHSLRFWLFRHPRSSRTAGKTTIKLAVATANEMVVATLEKISAPSNCNAVENRPFSPAKSIPKLQVPANRR